VEGSKGNSRSFKGSEIQSVRLNSRTLVTAKEVVNIYMSDYYKDLTKNPEVKYMIWQISKRLIYQIKKGNKEREKQKRLLASK
jgi:hypothetical protein